MKVKIDNKIYDSSEQPIILIFDNKSDRENIIKMKPEFTKYCSYPDGMDVKKIKEFMADDK